MIGVSKKSKYIYSNKIASKRNIQSLSVDNLMGVDYSSSMLNIQDNHAYDIKNFLKRNGTLQKRPPIEIIGIESLNGVWECNYKGTIYTIVHKGKHLYLVEGIENYDSLANNYYLLNGNATIEDQKSWGVFTNDRLYILCGNYIVVKFTDEITIEDGVVKGIEHSNVYDDIDTYIPTTTIGITANNSKVSISRMPLDNPNIMSSYRFNDLNSTLGEGEEYLVPNQLAGVFYLDADVNSKLFNTNSTEKVTIQYSYLDNKNNTIELNLEGVPTGGDIQFKVDSSSKLGSLNGTAESDNYVVFYIKYDRPNELVCRLLGQPIIENTDNITIKYKTNNKDESDLINKCTFGVMYGAGGNRNRLFVSGNPNKPNVDYHTSRRNIYANDADVDLLDNQDLTYFSVYDYCGYGTSNTAITDYQIMGDGSLMVLKEESMNEPNIYFRDSNYETKTIALGDAETQVVEETYPMRVGNIGEGAIKGHKGTLHNLNNDLVFVSNNGVFGISATVSAGMLNSDYKYSYGRSRLINAKLRDDLYGAKNIATIVYDHKYFLTIKKKDDTYITYVADGRYPYKLKDSIDNEYEYEWFVLDGVNADKYYVINEILCFSNKNGVYKFDLFNNTNVFVDKVNIPIKFGDLLYNTNNTYTLNSNINFKEIEESNSPKFVYTPPIEQDCYIELDTKVKFVSEYPPRFSLSECRERTKNIEELMKKHTLCLRRENTTINFIISSVYDCGDDIYQLYDSDGKIISTTWEYLTLCIYDNKKIELDIVLDEESNTIKSLNYLGDPIGFLPINTSTTIYLTGTIVNENNIECYYLTKSYNFGQSVYSKHLKSMTIINDSEQLSYTNFGIITKEVKKRFEDNYYSGTNGLVDTYENIFKADLTSGRFSSSFTKDYLLKFNFIQFEFYNTDNTNCIINNFTILYTTGFKTKGVS